MKQPRTRTSTLALLLIGWVSGCASQPVPPAHNRTVMDGLGDIARASIQRKERVAGALITAVAGAGGSLLVGARHDKIADNKVDEALQASAHAERSPANPDEVSSAGSADLNGDGFVTLDEVVAMKRAKLATAAMIDLLQKTQQVFELESWQEQYLKDRGVDAAVIDAMRKMHPDPAQAPPASAVSAGLNNHELPRGG